MRRFHRTIHRVWLALAIAAPLAAQDRTTPAHADPQVSQEAFQEALRRIAPGVVRIDTIGGALPVQELDDEGERRAAIGFRQADGPTTGVVWSTDGWIITSSFNFVRDPSIILVTLHDGTRRVAELVARDHVARLALLRVPGDDLQPLRPPDIASLRPGQWALAAGFGHGSAEPAVSVGIISALRRFAGIALQTDAKVSPANYGGPLIDAAGQLLGICVPLGPGEEELAGVEWYDSGIGFAIRADVLRTRVERMQDGTDLRRGLLGLVLDPAWPVVGVDPEPEAGRTGPEVMGEPLGPAADAGMAQGDVITHVNGAATPTLLAFRRAIAAHCAGDEVGLTVRRGDESIDIRLTLASEDALRERAAQTQPAQEDE